MRWRWGGRLVSASKQRGLSAWGDGKPSAQTRAEGADSGDALLYLNKKGGNVGRRGDRLTSEPASGGARWQYIPLQQTQPADAPYGQVAYGNSSLAPDRVLARQLLDWTHVCWRIENGLHYLHDKKLQQDATRMSNNRQAHPLAIVNNCIVALTKSLGFANLASARRSFNAKLDARLLSVT